MMEKLLSKLYKSSNKRKYNINVNFNLLLLLLLILFFVRLANFAEITPGEAGPPQLFQRLWIAGARFFTSQHAVPITQPTVSKN